MKYEKLSLENIGDGVLPELFNREIKHIVHNIVDENANIFDFLTRKIGRKISIYQ